MPQRNTKLRSRSLQATCRRAFNVRDRAWSELPYYAQWLGRGRGKNHARIWNP